MTPDPKAPTTPAWLDSCTTHRVEAVVAGHMGEPMLHMLEQMGIEPRLGATGDARAAAVATKGSAPG